MEDVVLFVHGTGVRRAGVGGLVRGGKAAAEQLGSHDRGERLLLGGSEGAELKAHGASIPDYDETGGDDPSPAEENLALWAVLYTDPWYELRLLGDWPTVIDELAPDQVTPSAQLSGQVEDMVPSEELGRLLARYDLRPRFEAARAGLKAAPELDRAVDTATAASLNEHRKAMARALAAFMLVSAERSGVTPIDGDMREAIVAAVIGDLNGFAMGITAWLSRPFKGIAGSMITQRIARRRGALTDATSPAAGDIMRYQARGSRIRGYIRPTVADAVAGDPDPSATILAYSLGGIACVDMLIEEPCLGVSRVVTAGSQAPFLYEIDVLSSLSYGKPLPDHFPPWLNIYDDRDFLSYIGAGVFPDRVTDQQDDNGQPFPQAHTAYRYNDAVWQQIKDFLA